MITSFQFRRQPQIGQLLLNINMCGVSSSGLKTPTTRDHAIQDWFNPWRTHIRYARKVSNPRWPYPSYALVPNVLQAPHTLNPISLRIPLRLHVDLPGRSPARPSHYSPDTGELHRETRMQRPRRERTIHETICGWGHSDSLFASQALGPISSDWGDFFMEVATEHGPN
jgi:hypothetical protein